MKWLTNCYDFQIPSTVSRLNMGFNSAASRRLIVDAPVATDRHTVKELKQASYVGIYERSIPYYVMCHNLEQTTHWLVGPFDTKDEACTWATNHEDKTNSTWLTLQLDNPNAPPTIIAP